MTDPIHVDLAFPVRGQSLRRDHGHALYGAISRAVPAVHGSDWLAVQNIPGRLVEPEVLHIAPQSMLRIRIPVDRIGALLSLAGATIDVLGASLQVGAPEVHQLRPAAALDAHLVVIKLTAGVGKPFDRAAFDERFAAEAHRQLARIGVVGEMSLRGRRSITVGGHRIIGHAVRVVGLSVEHSLALQVHGLGGKRTMGCGIFRQSRPRS